MTDAPLKPSRGEMRDQCVYIFRLPEGRVKVGRATLPGTRRCSVQRAYKVECEVAWQSEPHPRATEIETTAHQILSGFKVRGREVFRCSVTLAKLAIQTAITVQTAWLKDNPGWMAAHAARREAACAEYNAWRKAQGLRGGWAYERAYP